MELTSAKAKKIGNKGYERITGVVNGVGCILRGRCAAGRYNFIAVHSCQANFNAAPGSEARFFTMHSRRDLVKPSAWDKNDVVLSVVKIERESLDKAEDHDESLLFPQKAIDEHESELDTADEADRITAQAIAPKFKHGQCALCRDVFYCPKKYYGRQGCPEFNPKPTGYRVADFFAGGFGNLGSFDDLDKAKRRVDIERSCGFKKVWIEDIATGKRIKY